MKSVVMNITNRCNFACKTCMRQSSSNEDIDPDLYRKFIRELRRIGLERCAITGGEPILHPSFKDILAITAEEKLTFGIVTNGWFYEDYLEILEPFKKNVHFIALSIDGPTAEIHDMNRRPGSFDKVISAIETFIRRGYMTRVSHIVNRWNYDHLMATLDLIAGYHLTVSLGRTIATGTNHDALLTDAQARQLKNRLIGLKLIYPNIMTTVSLGLCLDPLFCTNFTLMQSISLRFDGNVVFCCDSVPFAKGAVLGNLGHENLEEILPRHSRIIGYIMEQRIKAMLASCGETKNDCDFCNELLRDLPF